MPDSSGNLAGLYTWLADPTTIEGDEYLIDPGTHSCTSTIMVNKPVKIRGAGAVAGPGTTGTPTIILDNTTGNNSIFWLSTIAGKRYEISYLTCQNGTTRTTNTSSRQAAAVRWKGTSTGIHVHHCDFDGIRIKALVVDDAACGCFGYNRVVQRGGNNALWFFHSTWAGGQYGDRSWSEPAPPGSWNAAYIEYCTIERIDSTENVSVTDTYGGCRVVFRYNTFADTHIATHGTDDGSGRERGLRWWEIYKNIFTGTLGSTNACHIRGGSGLYFDNTHPSGTVKSITLRYYRGEGEIMHKYQPILSPTYGLAKWDLVDYSDENGDGVFYEGTATEDGILLSGGEAQIKVAGAGWDLNQWRGYMVYVPSAAACVKGHFTAQIISNTSDTLRIEDSHDKMTGGIPVESLITEGESFQIWKLLLGLDCTGAGTSTEYTADATEPFLAPAVWTQEREPASIWGNTLNGAADAEDSPTTRLGEHFFTEGNGIVVANTVADLPASGSIDREKYWLQDEVAPSGTTGVLYDWYEGAWRIYWYDPGTHWLISGSGTAPSFAAHPASQSVTEGETAQFTAAASGSPLPTYQWRKDGAPLSDGGRISGVETATLTITAVEAGDAGSYDCVATNSEGTATSNAATLTVTPATAPTGNTYTAPRRTAKRIKNVTYQPPPPDPDPDPEPGAVTSVTWDVFTWTFLEPVYTGVFADGSPWVHRNGQPVTIASITPAYEAAAESSVWGGSTWHKNGSMLNPTPSSTGAQGIDSNVKGDYTRGGNIYTHALNIAAQLPYTVGPGNSIVSSQSWPTKWTYEAWVAYQGGDNSNWYQVKRVGILTVLAAAPAAGAFRPPFQTPSGVKPMDFNTSQIDWDLLLNLAHPTSLPDLATLTARAKQRQWRINNNWLSHYLCPLDAEYGYGRQLAHNAARYLAALNCDYTQAEKQELMYHVLQQAIDVYYLTEQGASWHADGGHNLGWKPYLVFGAAVFNHAGMQARANWDTYKNFQDDQQHWYVSEADVGRVLDTGKTQYTADLVGVPEWGIRHYREPNRDNAAWNATYRNENYAPGFGIAVVMNLMGLESTWNNPAYFDYLLNRVWAVSGGTSGFGSSPNSMAPWARDWRIAYVT